MPNASRPIVGVMVLGCIVVGGWVPAYADRPAVNKHSCATAGGAFANDKGTKSCTLTAQERMVGPVLTRTVRVEGGPRTGPSVDWIGTYQMVRVIEATTTQSQRGNRDVDITSVQRELSSTVEPLTCRLVLADTPEASPVDSSIANCVRVGVYPT